MNATLLIKQLQEQLQQQIRTVQANIAPLELTALNEKPGPESWSILECLEHLNRYSRYYNQKLSAALARYSQDKAPENFRQSWIGKKSVAMMEPGNGKKHKTVKHMNPNNSLLTKTTVTEFQQHLSHLTELLKQAEYTSLNKKAIPVEFFRLLKMNIGETFQFMLAHQERHLQQALRVKNQVRKAA